MAGLSLDHPWAFAFGILGNLISFMVYLAPIPTFIRVYRKKSTEGFQSEPYVVALFSAMLWIYYAFVKTDEYLLITINSFGCVIETIYIVMFLAYAPRKIKVYTAKMILILNVGIFLLIVLSTLLLTKGPIRVKLLGWICVALAVSVFAAPLSIIRKVVRTKSVEFMPFSLSFFLTLSAVVWFSYGLFTKDIYVAIPNILGFSFGVVQMVLYIIYKDAKELTMKDDKLPEHTVPTTKLNEMHVAPLVPEVIINEMHVAPLVPEVIINEMHVAPLVPEVIIIVNEEEPNVIEERAEKGDKKMVEGHDGIEMSSV